jgi:DNA-binding IclR family transcriptional regulator
VGHEDHGELLLAPQVEQVDQVDATYLLGSRNWVGVPVPPHLSALGKALYAGGALPLPTGSLETPTSVSIGTAEELRRHLASVRTAGYAVTVDELEVGLTGVAAPVTRGTVVVAAVGISGPTYRLQPTLEATGRIITQHARSLSARLSRTIKEGAA